MRTGTSTLPLLKKRVSPESLSWCERSARRRGHAGRVMRGRAIHLYRRSGCRSRRCVGLCIVVVAVLAAAADAMLVAHQAHPATIERNPKA